MNYASPDKASNATLKEAIYTRMVLRRLGVQVGELNITPMAQGGQVAKDIPESEFVELGFGMDEPLHLYVEIKGWGQDCDAEIGKVMNQFRMYGLAGGLRNMLPGWGCKSPDAHISNLPGVGTAVQNALARLANLGGSILDTPMQTVAKSLGYPEIQMNNRLNW